jgi:hypothetical protein
MDNYTFSWRTALMSAFLAFGVFAAVRFLFSSFFSPEIRLAGSLIGLPLGTFLGGYWAGMQTRYRPWLYGLFAAGVLVLFLGLFNALVYNLPVIALALALGPLAAWLAARGGFRSLGSFNLNRKWQLPGRENALYQQLLAMVRQDQYMAERLIDFERRRNPTAARERLIQYAIDRLRHDRR